MQISEWGLGLQVQQDSIDSSAPCTRAAARLLTFNPCHSPSVRPLTLSPDVAARAQLCLDCIGAHVRSVLAAVPDVQAHFGGLFRRPEPAVVKTRTAEIHFHFALNVSSKLGEFRRRRAHFDFPYV